MATGKSWSIGVPITRQGTTYGYVTVHFQEEYDIVSNRSTLKVTSMTGSNTLYTGTFYTDGVIYIDGAEWFSWTYNDYSFYLGAAGTVEFGSVSGKAYPTGKVINHNDDGSKTINVTVDINSYWRQGLSFGAPADGVTNSIALTTIPRASSITATDANIGAVSQITVTRKATVYTHSIKYDFGGLSGYVKADGTVSSGEVKLSETSIGFTVPTEFYAKMPNAKAGTCTLTVTTYSETTKIGANTCTFTVTAAQSECAPTVVGSVVDGNLTTLDLTGDENSLVRFFSEAVCTIDATAKNGAAITELYIAGQSVTSDVLLIPNVETNSFFFRAVDSRGYAGTATVVKDLVPYVKLTNNSVAARPDPTSGKATLTIQGSCYSGSFGAVDNAVTVTYSIDGGDPVSVDVSVSDNAYTATVELSGLDYQKSYTVEVIAADKLMTVGKTLPIQKGLPIFDWGEDDFRFNVPVSFASPVQPVNLLHNSNFARLVNQDGQTSYKGAGDAFDRWELSSVAWMVTLDDGYITVGDNPDSTSTATGMLRQYIAVDASNRGKTVTLAAKLKGSDVRLNINNTNIGAYAGQDDWYIKVVTGVVPEDADKFFVALQSRNQTTYSCEWVALYEGEYTAETLPPYVPKDHVVELAECQRYYVNFTDAYFRSYVQPDSNLSNVQIVFPVPMRITPTVTYEFSSGASIYGTNLSPYVANIYSEEGIILKNVKADAKL